MHYLHRIYQDGYRAGQTGDEDCPHTCGSHEWAWWWDGWGDGIASRVNEPPTVGT